MAARIFPLALRQAFDRLGQTNGAGAELAAALNSRGTLVLALPFVTGGLTLTALNLIAIESRLCDSRYSEALVCLLAHECSHVHQAHLVDSIQQELATYQAAARVADTLHFTQEKERYGLALTLDGTKPGDLEKARDWILRFANSSPATLTMYRRLPLCQPVGIMPCVRAAIVQLSSAGLAAMQVAWLLIKQQYALARQSR